MVFRLKTNLAQSTYTAKTSGPEWVRLHHVGGKQAARAFTLVVRSMACLRVLTSLVGDTGRAIDVRITRHLKP
jgi:hypothetical protein